MLRINSFRKVLLISLLTFLITSQAVPVSAVTNVWTSLGPEGGNITALVINPNTPSTLYVGTYSSGVYKSMNSGGTWSAANTGLTDLYVGDLAIDPTNPRTLYAGTWGGVFKSTDGGGNWSAVNTGLSSLLITTLAIDPKTPRTLYAGTYYCAMYKSMNGGGNWSFAGKGLVGYAGGVMALAIDPKTPSTLYVGLNGTGVYKSTDGGGNWEWANTGLDHDKVRALAINPTHPNTLYAGIFDPGGVYKSTNGAGNWEAVRTGLLNNYVYSLAIDPKTPSTLYAGTSHEGVYKSTNGGGNWEAVNTGLLTDKNFYTLTIDPTNPCKLYAGTGGNGVFVIQFCNAAKKTLFSNGSQDGWVLESGENSNKGGTLNSAVTTFNLGDDAARKQYRGILSFSTGVSLPDTAVITKVTLKIKNSAVVGGGNPVTTFQGFMVDIKKGIFGTAALQASDFQAVASRTYGPFNTALVSGWYSINLTSARDYINKLVTGSGLTQIRLRFKLDDNNNAVANYLRLYSGNAGTLSRPKLIIEYYVP